MITIITGSVGTGKSTIARKLASELNYQYLDVNELIKKNKLYEGFDRRYKSYIVDIKKLNKFLIDYIKEFKKFNNKLPIELTNRNVLKKYLKNIRQNKLKVNKKNTLKKYNGLIIDSHLSHYLPKKYVDFCIVAKCDLKELNKRLKKRKYSKAKIRENLDVEIFDVCYEEVLNRGYKPIIINTSKNFDIKGIIDKLGGKNVI